MKKICLVYNYAQYYRKEIFQLLDNELNCNFYFGDKMGDVKKLDYSLLKNFQGELVNRWVGNSIYYQQGISQVLKQRYDHYIFLGEVRCLSTWRALFRVKFSKQKIYLWTHGWYGKENKVEKILKKLFFYMADGILLYGNYARNLMIQEGFNPKKLYVIYNSLSYDEQIRIRAKLVKNTTFESHFNNCNKNLIFIGRLTPVKKLDMILYALANLKKQREQYNLTFIGDGEGKEQLLVLCNRLGIIDKVWFYGTCYDEVVLSNLIYNADLCVSPGNVGLTAMHCMVFGVPVITHNRFELQMPEYESIIKGKTGDFFDYDDQKSLENTISKFFKSGYDREIMRKSCYRVINEKYNPHIQLKTIKDVLGIKFS